MMSATIEDNIAWLNHAIPCKSQLDGERIGIIVPTASLCISYPEIERFSRNGLPLEIRLEISLAQVIKDLFESGPHRLRKCFFYYVNRLGHCCRHSCAFRIVTPFDWEVLASATIADSM